MKERVLGASEYLESIYTRLQKIDAVERTFGVPLSESEQARRWSGHMIDFRPTSSARSELLIEQDKAEGLEELMGEARALIETKENGWRFPLSELTRFSPIWGKPDFIHYLDDLSWILLPNMQVAADVKGVTECDLTVQRPILGYWLMLRAQEEERGLVINFRFASDQRFVLSLGWRDHCYCSGILPWEKMTDEEYSIVTYYLQKFNQLAAAA